MEQLYSLIRDGISENQPIDIIVDKLSESFTSSEDKPKFIDMLADVLVQYEIETTISNEEQHKHLINLIRTIVKTDLLPPLVALERFETETVVQIGLITDKKQFMVSYNRLRTKLYFKQKKYNLLREENTGFSKILVCLFQLNSENINSTLDTIIHIIGRFRVDPNRVLDLTLEILEYRYNEANLIIDFLKLFYDHPTKLTQMVILKLTFYTNIKPNEQLEPIIPPSFYRLLAILISKELLDLEDIYPYLKPLDSKILEYHKKLTEEARAYSRKYNIVIVGEEKPSKSVFESLSNDDKFELEIDNHKTNICLQLLNEGDWAKALDIVRKLPEYYLFQDMRVSRVACDYIGYLIDPIYREWALPKPLNLRISPKLPREGHPQFNTIDDIKTKLFPMLSTIGPFLHADILLMTKIIRLLKHILTFKEPESNENLLTSEGPLYYKVIDVINESILPSMSLSGSNTCLARELWSLLRMFKYQTRYRLYYNWRDEGSNPSLLRTRGFTLLRAKHHMKRLSKDTLKHTGRHLGKLCYANPIIPIQYILIQVQSYDNLIGLVVDAFRYLPPIAIDAALYCVLECLLDPHKNKKSIDGLNIAPWLTSLSSFSSNIILRYKVEFIGFLDYISNQLKAGNSLDLVLLTDLIQKMTGIEAIQAITDEKLEALMGGDILRAEGAYYNQDRRNTRKSSARLKDALIESRLAMPLCISMAQLRDTIFFHQQDTSHLKLIGNLYDQCQETFVQYGAFVSMNLSIEDYINYLPPVEKLMMEYKLDPDSAFFLARPMIMHKIKSKFVELKDIAIKEIPAEEGETPELTKQEVAKHFIDAAKSVIDPLSKAIIPALVESYGSDHPYSKLFVIFWTLTMSDIDVPINCYEREIQRLKQIYNSEGSNSNNNIGNNNTNNSVITGNPNKIMEDENKRRKERERCNSLIQKLKQEQAEQVEHAGLVKMYLESERSNLFSDKADGPDNVHLDSRQFVQHCPFARSILSASDAIYSARFLSYLHELKVDNFPTLICLDRLLCDLTYMMSACTENEAHHYGRFLRNILKTIAHWHSGENIYKEECEDHPGSIIKIEQKDHISFENYRHICNKWHYRLTRSFTVALESTNYIQIRNALIVMIAIIEYYPAIKHFGKGIGLKIDEVRSSEKDNRPDLFALATSYAVKLDEKKPHLVSESEFHKVEPSATTKDRHSSSSSRKKARHA